MANKDVSIIFPVFNERGSIERVIQEWADLFHKNSIQAEVIVCEDGSKDGTSEFLREIQKKYQLVLDQSKERRGYGRAVISGMEKASGAYIFCVDSDGQYDPMDFLKLWKVRNHQEIFVGCRSNRQDSFLRKLYSGTFKLFFSILFSTNVRDPSSPFVLFHRSYVMILNRYLQYLLEGFWWGFTAACVKKKIRIRELPILHRDRLEGNTKVYSAGKIPSIAFRNGLGLLRLRFAK